VSDTPSRGYPNGGPARIHDPLKQTIDPALDRARQRATFDIERPCTIGLEEELMLLTAQIESVTSPKRTVAGAGVCLSGARGIAVHDASEGLGGLVAWLR
jgi:hypothetical protein